jgi:protein TonB
MALVVALHLLLALLFMRLATPPATPPAARPALTVFDLMPETSGDQAKAAEAEAEAAEATSEAEEPVTPPVPPAQPVAPPASEIWSKVIPLTRDQLAAADIATMPSQPAARDEGEGRASGNAGGADSNTEGPGTGPNGEPLYNAEWYRRPTSAELGFYLPTGSAPTGWGMIACQTVEDYRVDNCQEIAQSPAGSGLSRAVLQAAWQFRVLPPRIGGRPMIGAWVRIRIDYSVRTREASRPG